MGLKLNDFESKAREDYKGLEVEADDGSLLFTLRSSIRLNDAETAKLQAAQDKLADYQATKDPEEGEEVEAPKTSDMRRLVADILVALSDSPQRTKEFLRPLDLALHMTIFKSYREQTQAAEGN